MSPRTRISGTSIDAEHLKTDENNGNAKPKKVNHQSSNYMFNAQMYLNHENKRLKIQTLCTLQRFENRSSCF